jgi:hypothetical protein
VAGSFDLAWFYARVEATSRERSWLRQDLVRGLKDWYFHVYGYDRYGAETAFLIRERMGEPRIFGFAMLRIVRDRRVSDATKAEVVAHAIDTISQQSDLGPPYGLVEGLLFLVTRATLPAMRLRYALLAVIAHEDPFAGIEGPTARAFMAHLLSRDDLPPEERAFWAHSLVTHHVEGFRVGSLVDTIMQASLPLSLRRELCWAWVHQRQPKLEVPVPQDTDSPEAAFVSAHMPFWVAHMRSWPRASLVRRGLLWLSRLGEDPLTLAEVFIAAVNPPDEQALGAVADILAEHHGALPPEAVKRLIDQGIAQTGSLSSRRRFYRLGADLIGPEYLSKAAGDSAASVRQWAARQLEKESSATPEESLPLTPGAVDQLGYSAL